MGGRFVRHPQASGVLGGNAVDDIDMKGNRITDSTAPLNLGTAATTGHSLAAGDTLIGGKLEVDGVAYFDGASIVLNSGNGTVLRNFNSILEVRNAADTGWNDLRANSITAQAGVSTAGNVTSGAASAHKWSGSTKLTAPADGKMILINNAGAQGVLFDTTTDGTLALTDESAGALNLSFGGDLAIGGSKITHTGGVKTGLTDAGSNDLFHLSMATQSHLSGIIHIAVHADDGTDYQIRRSEILFTAVRVAGGGITIDTQVAAAAESVAVSGGTLTLTVGSADNGDGTFDISVTPNSSLTPTTLEAHYWVELDTASTLTAL